MKHENLCRLKRRNELYINVVNGNQIKKKPAT